MRDTHHLPRRRGTGRHYLALLALASGLGLGTHAQAATVDISAAYRPSSSSSEFQNTTPPSGFCVEYGGCGNQITSVALPVQYDRNVLSGLPPASRRWSLQAPPQANVTLTSAEGNTLAAQFQITHMAQVLSGTGFDKLENPANHSSTGGNCSFVAPYGSDGGNAAGFIWRMADPVSPGLCYPATAGTSKQLEITPSARRTSVGYRLILPAPHTVKAGAYQGSVTYSIGEAGDFSLGSRVSNLSDNSVTFNFSVTVQHELSVTFPAGSDHVDLQPSESYGGWHQYLTGQKPPPGSILKILPFQISTSGPFKLTMRCDETNSVDTCVLRSARNQLTARVLIFIELPPAITHMGQPVRFSQLNHNRTVDFQVTQPVLDQQGRLRIVIENTDFKWIMLPNPGNPFQNGITLVFDAQV